MQNYIIINGVPSWEIPGLIICTLPPVTKPAKKLTTLSIPGANGDIVTSIGGYEPYDRKFKVGVSRAIGDLEQIVQYLDQSGEIIYGNEPDKIYTMRQTARIDLNALVRYYQADVVQTVQPIKRSVLAPISIDLPPAVFGVPAEVVNAGNAIARPVIKVEVMAASCKIRYARNDGTTFDVVIDPGIAYNQMTIELDASTGNATGTLDTGNPATSRSGYLTDIVDVDGGDITDLYLLPEATPCTLTIPSDSHAIPSSLVVTNYIAFI